MSEAVTHSAVPTESHTDSTNAQTGAFDYRAFVHQLVNWFGVKQRDLPWRRAENIGDPYRVLVSEVMLQQTTVAAVAPRYEAFLQQFPTAHSLAVAPLDDVLAAWQGLGYYSRARNLHAAAQQVIERHGGTFPQDHAAISQLSGVGRYTAGAVSSIALNLPTAIVDANVARVVSRLRCIEGDVKTGKTHERIWNEAEALIQAGVAEGIAPRELNPSLMELGALICLPRGPRCEACPVIKFCAAYATGRQNELPHAAPKRATIEQHDVCLYAQDGDKVLLRQRSHAPGVWWRGMWELPRTKVLPDETPEAALQRLAREELGLAVRPQSRLKTLEHGVTHHHIQLACWDCEVTETEQPLAEAARWLTWDETEALAVPSTMRTLMRWLRTHPSGTGQLSLL